MEYVLPILDEYSVKATFYVIPNLVGKRLDGVEMANWTLIKKASMQGHEIGSHTMNHSTLPADLWDHIKRFSVSIKNSPDKIKFIRRSTHFCLKTLSTGIEKTDFDPHLELNVSKKLISERTGNVCESFAYPGGVYSSKAAKMVEGASFSSARTLVPGFNTPATSPFYLKSFLWTRDTKTQKMNELTDKALERKEWIIESFHLVGHDNETNYPYYTKVDNLVSHLDYVLRGSNLSIVTVKEGIELMKGVAR